MRTPLITTTTVVFLFDAFAWLIAVLFTLRFAFVHRILPTVGGIRLLSGPFESLGINALIVAGLIYVVVSALKILAAYWLWNARLDGAVFGLILLGLSAIFWYGFALPFGPVVGVAEIVLLALVWKQLG